MNAIKDLISANYRHNSYGRGLKEGNDCFGKQFPKGNKIIISKGFLKHLTVKF